MKMNKKLLAVALATAATFSAMQANAASQGMGADVTFVVPLKLENPVNVDFGNIEGNIVAGQTVIIDTLGVISGSGATSQLTGEAAGGIDLTALPTPVNIQLDAFTSTNAAIFTLSAPRCSYDGGTETDCWAGDGYSVTPANAAAHPMTIGLTLTAQSATEIAPASYSETFNVVAVYP